MLMLRKSIFMLVYVLAGILIVVGLSSQRSAPAAMSHSDSVFETAVTIIKKYETLHHPRHWPLVGYGHLVLPGERFSRSRTMNESDADALLRKDLLKNCAVFREFGADSLLLGVLAYNIGSGKVKSSSIVKKLADGDRNIRELYLSYNKYRGKRHAGLSRRRIEEFETLFIPDLELAEKIVPPDTLST